MPASKRPLPDHSSEPGLSVKRKREISNIMSNEQRSVEVASGQKTNTFLTPWRLKTLPGSEVFYVPKFVDSDVSKGWYKQLNSLETWYHPKLKVYGKEVFQSRSIAAYATSPCITVKYSGHRVDMQYTYPDIISEIQAMVESKLGMTFNHVMLNRYENGNEYIGRHRDTKENKAIASLSLGAERIFIFTPNTHCPGSPTPHSFILQCGSLLVMQGETQKNWKHEIPKEPQVKQGRISLTFRQLECS